MNPAGRESDASEKMNSPEPGRNTAFSGFSVQADASGRINGCTITLSASLPAARSAAGSWHDTALPFAGSEYRPKKAPVPEKLREMSRLYEYGRESLEMKAKNFIRQARFMQDYEDDFPWEGLFFCYFPSYHDMTARQLRGYFSWRTKARQGIFGPLPVSAAYLYLYELLNGIGCRTPQEVLESLKRFEAGFLDAGQGDARMRANLRRWMTEYAVLKDLPPEEARAFADPALLERDAALAVLKDAAKRPDEEVFDALCRLSGRKLTGSPVLLNDPARGRRLFAEIWRRAAEAFRESGQDLFAACFGAPKTARWTPLSNVLYLPDAPPAEREYRLSECRRYLCRGGSWLAEAFDPQDFDKKRLQGLLHEADLKLRRYLKTGRPLKPDPEDIWADPAIAKVIEEDRRAVREAARPKISLDLSDLDRIRHDASLTRESLLSEEERFCWEEELPESAPDAEASAGAEEALPPAEPALPLDPLSLQVLRALLDEKDPAGLIREHHAMPALIADSINEALFDKIQDTVLLCENERLSLVEDYREELEQLLGGNSHG